MKQLLKQSVNQLMINGINISAFCYSDPCANGGTCRDVDDNHIECLCPDGFSGSFCETGKYGEKHAVICHPNLFVVKTSNRKKLKSNHQIITGDRGSLSYRLVVMFCWQAKFYDSNFKKKR